MPRAFPWLLYLLIASPLFAQTSPPPMISTPKVQEHLSAAQRAQESQDYETARREYETALELAPNFAEVHMNLGLVYQLQGDDSKAMAEFRTALKLKPLLTGANFFLGVDYCKQGDGTSAIPYLKTAVAQQPERVELLSWLATAQDLTSQFSSEVATLHRALTLQPRNIDLLYMLGQAYEHLGKQQAADLKKADPDSARSEQLVAESYASSNEWPSAVIHFENAISKSPKSADLHVELGEVYLHAGRLKQASSEFDEALSAKPNSVRALVRNGEVALLRGETSNALHDWNRALQVDPLQVQQVLGLRETGFGDSALEQVPDSLRPHLDEIADQLKENKSPAARVAVAFISGNENDLVKAKAAIPDAKTSCSTTAVSTILSHEQYSTLSHCTNEIVKSQLTSAQRIQIAGGLLQAGDYQSSIRVLDSLPVSERHSVEASYWRARCYEKLATAAYLQMYEVDRDSYRVHQLLGDLAATRNDDAKAIEEYRAAIHLKTTTPNLHYSLGHMLWKDLKVPEARTELEAELKMNPRHAGALHDMGDTFLLEHQPEKALPYLKQAVSAYPTNPDIHRDLGTAYAQLKEYTKAVAEYKLGLANDEDGSVHYKLAKVYQTIGDKPNADREFAIYTTMNRETHEKLEKRGQRLADIERSAE